MDVMTESSIVAEADDVPELSCAAASHTQRMNEPLTMSCDAGMTLRGLMRRIFACLPGTIKGFCISSIRADVLWRLNKTRRHVRYGGRSKELKKRGFFCLQTRTRTLTVCESAGARTTETTSVQNA